MLFAELLQIDLAAALREAGGLVQAATGLALGLAALLGRRRAEKNPAKNAYPH